MADILKQGFKAQAASLRDFGYPDVDAQMVELAHEKWKRGDELTNVIEMFCKSAFEDHPEIFGEPAA